MELNSQKGGFSGSLIMPKTLNRQKKTVYKRNDRFQLGERCCFSFRKLKDDALVKGVCVCQLVFLGIVWMGEDNILYFHRPPGGKKEER